VLWVLWITYGSFYFCRANLGVAVPGIGAEFGFSKTELGWVLMALKLSYGVGQFVNGQLAERISPRRLLAIGLLASAALNIVFGFATSLYFMIFLWACNGYVQSLGWPPTMRVAANWFEAGRHGRTIGLIGTGYQLCGALTFFLSGWAASTFGWRGVLLVPSTLLVISALHMWFLLEERPTESSPGATSATRPVANANSLKKNLLLTLSNPALWFIGIALWMLDACRYGFSDWGVTHLKEVQGGTVSSAAFKYAVLPVGGIVGTLISGWVTDRFFASRRVPTIVMMLIALGLLAVAYDSVIQWGLVASVTILFFIGFCIYGSQVLLVGTLPVELARAGTAAAAAGFVNFAGYMGAAGGDLLTGQIAQERGWTYAVRFWAGCAFVSAMAVACIWNRERRLRAANNHASKS
jgi:MFS transporter, OPA family, glycerol-3-phosphate transporter